jgi:hypothetical protein
MRGYFGIGVEGASKPMNFGNLARSAHGFGASFVFSVAPARRIGQPPSDTSRSQDHLPGTVSIRSSRCACQTIAILWASN